MSNIEKRPPSVQPPSVQTTGIKQSEGENLIKGQATGPVRLSERGIENPDTETAPRVKQSWIAFKFEVFFANLEHGFWKLLGDFNIVSLPVEKPGIESLFKPDLSVENTLLTLIDCKKQGVELKEILKGNESTLKLKRLVDNIQKAKAAGADVAFDVCIKQSSENLGKKQIFQDTKQLLTDIEREAKRLLGEKVEGYEPEPEGIMPGSAEIALVEKMSNFNVSEDGGYFSEEFSQDLFKEYLKEPPVSETKSYITPEGKNVIVCQQAYLDLQRTDYVLTDKFGNKFESDRKSYPVFSGKDEKELREKLEKDGLDEKEIKKAIEQKKDETALAQHAWKKDLIDKFLKFCGYDDTKVYANDKLKAEAKEKAEKKLLKLSQSMSQTMGNGYELACLTGEHSPQLFQGGTFQVSGYDSKSKAYLKLTEEDDGSLTLTRTDEFESIGKIILPGTGAVMTDPEGSYYKREVGIILDPSNEWKEYKEGGIEYKIVEIVGGEHQT